MRKAIKAFLFILLMGAIGLTNALAQPTGVINGLFSVNENVQVYFSRGNLQYQASTNIWRFAINQYDCVGIDNTNISQTYSGWVDLFGWGTSGWNNGNTYYCPWDTNNSDGSLYGPPGQYDLMGNYANSDWGIYNAIINGGNQAGLWRTMTSQEWVYVFKTRSASTINGVANARYAKAKVANIHGVILFPDNYVHPSGVTLPVGINQDGNTGWNGNDYSATDFAMMDANGAVFLPAAGERIGVSVGSVGEKGTYWSASHGQIESSAYHVSLFSDQFFVPVQDNRYRWGGRSIRLVRPIENYSFEIEAAPDPENGGIIEGAGIYEDRSTCTLKALANEGYTFVNWKRNGQEVSTNNEYSFTVTENATFEAHFEEGQGFMVGRPESTNSYLPSNSRNRFTLSQQIYTSEEIGGSKTITSLSFFNVGDSYYFEGGIYLVHTEKTAFDSNTDWIAVSESDKVFDGEVIIKSGFWTTIVLDTPFVYNGNSNLAIIVDNNSWGYSYVYSAYRVFGTNSNQAIYISDDNPNFDPYNPFGYGGTLLSVKNHIIININRSVNAIVSPNEGGIIDGTGFYEAGTTCTLIATANEGYTFMYWTENGNQVSTNANYTFTVTENVSYEAVFSPNSYTISVSANPSVGGMVSGAGTYNHGSICTLTATPATGYSFVRWTKNGNQVSTNATYSFTVTENATYAANFSINGLHFITTGTWSTAANWQNGALPGANDEAYIDAPCQLDQDATVFALTVTDGQSLTLQSGKTLIVTNTLTNTSTTGLVIEDGAQLEHASNFVSATVKKYIAGYRTGNDKFLLISNPLASAINPELESIYHITRGNYDLYDWLATAPDCLEWRNFKDDSFMMYADGYGYLYAHRTNTYIEFPGTLLPSKYRFGKTVSYDANDTEHPGWNLIGNPFVCNAYLVNENNEPLPYYRMNAAGDGLEFVTSGAAIVPMEGVFYQASENGTVYFIRTDNTSQIPTSWTISVSACPSDGGTVSGNGTYQSGQNCTVTATANEGYSFANWTENGSVVSTEANYTFIVNADHILVANFTGDHNYVDLGLPSGTLWATCNVGADTPEGYGDYFAWGETTTKDTYNWSTYQYCNGSNNTLTKYCNNSNYGYNGFTDNLTTLEPNDDAATANWGNGWRMPTEEEWQELYQNTTHTWTTQNGVNGRLFTAANGNSLFLPAAGYRWGSGLNNAGSYGGYWSSSLYSDVPNDAWYFYFYSDYYYMYYIDRGYGRSVRPVRSARQN